MKIEKTSLSKSRESLDKIDNELLSLLVKRFKIINEIAYYKKQNNIPVIIKDRINYIINKSKMIAEKNNINPIFFENIYKTIINTSCDMENDIIFKNKKI